MMISNLDTLCIQLKQLKSRFTDSHQCLFTLKVHSIFRFTTKWKPNNEPSKGKYKNKDTKLTWLTKVFLHRSSTKSTLMPFLKRELRGICKIILFGWISAVISSLTFFLVFDNNWNILPQISGKNKLKLRHLVLRYIMVSSHSWRQRVKSVMEQINMAEFCPSYLNQYCRSTSVKRAKLD